MRIVAWLLLASITWVGPVERARAQAGDKAGEVQQARVPREKIPPAPPLSPDDALRSFRPQPGFRVELVASEPMVEVPVLSQFDEDGRMWVVEMRGFMLTPSGDGETNAIGRISILEDVDGDGRMDTKKIFLDGLVLPRALLLVQGGVLVCEPPQLWYYPNQGDRAGERVLVADDFAKEADPKLGARMNPEHSGNSLLWGMDNWVYSLYHNFRYRLHDGRWQREPMPRRAQWGLSRDSFGRLFYTSNSDQLRGDMVPSHYAAHRPDGTRVPGIGVQVATNQTVFPIRVNPGVNRGYQSDTLRDDGTLEKFTAACGTCIYRGDLFGPEFDGNAFLCEPSANLIRRNLLSEHDGVVSARNPYVHAEFLASTDELFRPVNLLGGPDGALYVVDMYHGIIQHRFFLTSYLRHQAEERGLQNVTNKGRIYRLVPTGRAPGPRPALSKASTAELVRTLAHANGWWRDTAQRLLVERNDTAAVPALEELARHAPDPIPRLHALWTLEGMERLNLASIESALADPHPKIRAAAIRLAEPCFKAALGGGNVTGACAAVAEKVFALTNDPAADVQIQRTFTLGLTPTQPRALASLLQLTNSPLELVREAAVFGLAIREPSKSGLAAAARRAAMSDSEKKLFQDGKAMFEATCLACHQQHGMGQEGLAPPLAGSEWVAGPPERLARIVLHGLRGPIHVKGRTFELDMPALGVLEDDQIASALTYVRNEWGHAFSVVSPELVKKARTETAAREEAWTEKDLLRVGP